MTTEVNDLDRVAGLLAKAERVLFITGAGVSADSGLPTYRGIGGLYEGADASEGLPIEEILSGPMLHARPELTWKHLLEIETACRGAEPNRAHLAMVELELNTEVCILTQNVDGLHRRAGSTLVIDIHGDVRDLLCTRCSWTDTVSDYSRLEIPPICDCGGLIRPDVVLFGEMLATTKLAALQAQIHKGFDIVFSVGTTSLFPHIAGPVLGAATQGTPTVEINPGDTEISGIVGTRLRMGAAEALHALCKRAGV